MACTSRLALVVVLVAAGFVNDKQTDERNAKFIESPAAGDVYEVKTKEGQYTLMKLAEVKGDSLFVRLHQYETNKRTGLTELKQKSDTAYSEDVLVLLKPDVRDMLKAGEILEVIR